MHDNSQKENIVLVISGSKSTLPLVEEIHKRGYLSYVFDKDENSPCKKIASKFFQISAYDYSSILLEVEPIITRVKGIVCYSSFYKSQFATAYISEIIMRHKQIKTYSRETVEVCFDKKNQKKLLTEAKINLPTIMTNNIKYPVVYKQLDSVGSQGVRIVSSLEELQQLVHTSGSDYFLEKYIDGKFIMVAGYVVDNQVNIIGFFNKRIEVLNGVPLTIGYDFINDLSEYLTAKEIENMRSEIQLGINKIGINNQYFGVDIIVDSDGVSYFLEFGLLLDAKIDRLLLYMGYPVYSQLVDIVLGCEPNTYPLNYTQAKLRFIYTDKSGVLANLYSQNCNVEWQKEIGDIVSIPKSISDILGWVIQVDNNVIIDDINCSQFYSVR